MDNLERDFYLRKRMDSEGFLPIDLIATFHRVQALTTDVGLIVKVSMNTWGIIKAFVHLSLCYTSLMGKKIYMYFNTR